MKLINNLDVFELIPQSLRNDSIVQANFVALQKEVDELIGEINKIPHLPNLTVVNDDVLAHIAANWGLDAEDGWGIIEIDPLVTRAKKELFIQLSWDLHRYKGTKYALEQIINFVGLSGKVESWWQYGAAPYHFRITITGATNYQPWQVDLLSKLILKYQSVRDDGEIVIELDYLPWYYAQAMIVTTISESIFIENKNKLKQYFAATFWINTNSESIPLN